MVQNDETRRILAAITTRLTAAGYTFTVTDKDTVRLELFLADGRPYAITHIAVAESFLAGAQTARDAMRGALGDYHYEELDADRETRLDITLLLVGEEAFIRSPDFAELLESLPLDGSSAKKHICSVDEVLTWLGNPFTPWRALASSKPEVHVVNERRHEWDAPVPENKANYRFERLRPGVLRDDIIPHDHPRLAEIQALTSHLVSRIQGTAITVNWADFDKWGLPCVGRGEGMPLFLAGSGEQLAFSLSLFLAKAYVSEQPGLYLHLPNVLYQFDSMRRFSALECLRDFLLATGASLYLESNQSNVLSVAKHKLRFVSGLTYTA